MLTVDKVSKTFFPGTVNERKALSGVELTLDEGDFVTVIGSNGAGKSTLLNAVSGRLSVDSGRIEIAGSAVNKLGEHSRARYVGRVFQDPLAGTAPNLTIEENLSLALRRGKRRGLGRCLNAKRRAHFREELASLELGLDVMSREVGQSGDWGLASYSGMCSVMIVEVHPLRQGCVALCS